MNYDQLNQVSDYWIKEIFPNLKHYITISSFDDYLKQMSMLPSLNWLTDFKSVKVLRVPFVVDPGEFTKKYKKNCVAYACPAKAEDGLHRVVYQISPTLHLEAGFWIWVERESVQSYMSMFACFKDEAELLKFLEELMPIRREGNTEEPEIKGFAGHDGRVGF